MYPASSYVSALFYWLYYLNFIMYVYAVNTFNQSINRSIITTNSYIGPLIELAVPYWLLQLPISHWVYCYRVINGVLGSYHLELYEDLPPCCTQFNPAALADKLRQRIYTHSSLKTKEVYGRWVAQGEQLQQYNTVEVPHSSSSDGTFAQKLFHDDVWSSNRWQWLQRVRRRTPTNEL